MKALGDELDDEFANSQVPKRFSLEEDFDTPDMSVLPTAMQIRKTVSSIQAVFDASKLALASNRYRTTEDVLPFLMEEVGELSTEIMIRAGKSGKKKGDDGVIGEAVDVILCALDIIFLDYGPCDSEDLEELIHTIIKTKAAKWKAKQQQS